METWRGIEGWEDLYQVSDLGRVRVLDRTVVNRHGVQKRYKGKVLKPQPKGKACYQGVGLNRNDMQVRQAYVHHLVLETFVGPRPFPDAVTRHRNGNNQDNRLSNLLWGTQSENMEDKKLHGTDHQLNKTHCPRRHPYSGDNLIVYRGGRFCRACKDLHVLDLRAKRKAARHG